MRSPSLRNTYLWLGILGALLLEREGLCRPNTRLPTPLQQQVIASNKHRLAFPSLYEMPAWAKEQIASDLSRYAEGISEELLEESFASEMRARHLLVRVVIANGVLRLEAAPETEKHPRYSILANRLIHLSRISALPDAVFIVSLHDASEEEFPWFIFSKARNNRHQILMPDSDAINPFPPLAYPYIRATISEAVVHYPWTEKLDKAFWRGGTTGVECLTLSNWHLAPRSQLVLFSDLHPHLLDAHFVLSSDGNLPQADSKVQALLQKEGRIAPYCSITDHLRYKYLIDIDGNANTFCRMFWILLSNSTLFKVISSKIQWYYKGLEPWVHFVPCKEDLSDLEEKILWAKNHDDQAKKIAEAGSAFAMQHLSDRAIDSYLYHLIVAYASLLVPEKGCE